MKTFTMWLLDGKEITLKGETYEDLSCMTCCDLEYYWYQDEEFINE